MSSAPVLFVGTYKNENGDLPYLEDSVQQARKFDNDIILLGQPIPCVDKQFYIEGYEESAKGFDKVYKHMTFNEFKREIMAFRRWFIVRDFMVKEGLDRLFLCENDVLLFCNVTEATKGFSGSALSSPLEQQKNEWCSSGHCALWELSDLEALCDLSIRYYTEKISVLEKKWNFHQQNNVAGGICDMTLLYFLTQEHPIENLNALQNNSFFDHNISVSRNAYENEYAMDFCRIKRIRLKNKQFFAFNQRIDRWVKANSLHFSGAAKQFIPYFTKSPWTASLFLRLLMVTCTKLRDKMK